MPQAGGRPAPAEPMRPGPGARTFPRRHRPPLGEAILSTPPTLPPTLPPKLPPTLPPAAPAMARQLAGRPTTVTAGPSGAPSPPAARRAAAGALLLLAATLGLLQSAAAQTVHLDTTLPSLTVNIAEKAAGFTFSGVTRSYTFTPPFSTSNRVVEAGVSVTVVFSSLDGSTTSTPLTATSSANGTWSVRVPANAAYITELSHFMRLSLTKTGFPEANLTSSILVDLTAPTAPTYTVPVTLKEGGGHRRHGAGLHRHRRHRRA